MKGLGRRLTTFTEDGTAGTGANDSKKQSFFS